MKINKITTLTLLACLFIHTQSAHAMDSKKLTIWCPAALAGAGLLISTPRLYAAYQARTAVERPMPPLNLNAALLEAAETGDAVRTR